MEYSPSHGQVPGDVKILGENQVKPPVGNVITSDDQFSDPSRHRSKTNEPIFSRSRVTFSEGCVDISSDCALKSESSLDGLENCSGTEIITDIHHKGSCRLVPCSVGPGGHKRVAPKDETGVVDRASCVGGVSLLRRGVSPRQQTASSEEPSSMCPVALASEHTSMPTRPLLRQFRGIDRDETDESAHVQSCTGKRARTRLRHKRAKAQASTHDCLKGLVDCDAHTLSNDDRWVEISHGDWPITFEERSDIDAFRASFDKKELIEATSKYEKFQGLPAGSATFNQVQESCAGIQGWIDYNPDVMYQVGKKGARTVQSADLCGLWARQALMVASESPQWERLVLTVDSGASDTVIPPSVACNLPLLHSPRVGIEYEVANGGVLTNLGERQGKVIMSRDSDAPFLMSFQVVKVHKPLLAVSRLVAAGHEVHFDKENPHILLSTGQKPPMLCNGGTYEVEIWIENPPGKPELFARQSR